MRRLDVVAALALATAVAPAAQTTFGVRAGVSAIETSFDAPDIYGRDDGPSKHARLGFTVGAYADVPLSGAVSLRPGLSYVQKGYHVVLEEGPFAGSGTWGADYLEAPILLGVRVPRTGALELGVEVGPTLGYRVRTVDECEDGFVPSCEQFPYGDDLVDFEVGGTLGLTVGAGPFGVGVRYAGSLARVDDPDIVAFDDVRYGGLTATAHYVFGR